MLNAVVRPFLVDRQLFAAILQRKEAEMVIESHLIDPVLTFHFAVMTRCCNLDSLVFNAHLLQALLKQGFGIVIVAHKRLCKLRPIVRLDPFDWKRCCFHQQYQK